MKKLIGISLVAILTACTQVEDTEVCFKKHFGEYANDVMTSGLHGYNIFTTDVICVDARIQKHTGQLESYTKDLQIAHTVFVLAVAPQVFMAMNQSNGNMKKI